MVGRLFVHVGWLVNYWLRVLFICVYLVVFAFLLIVCGFCFVIGYLVVGFAMMLIFEYGMYCLMIWWFVVVAVWVVCGLVCVGVGCWFVNLD